MPTQRRTWLGLAVAALVAACSESTSPPLPDSQGLNSDLQTVSAVFQTDVFKSFGAIGTAPGSPAATTIPPGALLRGTSPLAPSSTKQPYAATPQRLQALRVAAAGMSAAATGVIPQTLWGKTYVWDVNTHQYVEDPNQFDTNRHGIRIILYQVDASGQVIEPPVQVGHVDLLDESDANTSKLHVIVQDASASPVTYADYERLHQRRGAHCDLQRVLPRDAARHPRSGPTGRRHLGPGQSARERRAARHGHLV